MRPTALHAFSTGTTTSTGFSTITLVSASISVRLSWLGWPTRSRTCTGKSLKRTQRVSGDTPVTDPQLRKRTITLSCHCAIAAINTHKSIGVCVIFNSVSQRDPEGMWLPETAVDTETLEIMAQLGIKFTILSPYQARRTKRLRGRAWKDVNGGKVDPSTPYVVRLPSGQRMTVFFYDGPISQAIAFEKLLERGENLVPAWFLHSLTASDPGHNWCTSRPMVRHMVTITNAARWRWLMRFTILNSNKLAKLTNYGEYLEKHPPVTEAEIWEKSAWSCSHGVERWNSNCGCNSGGHPGWNQEWRHPLRAALDWLRDTIIPQYEQKGSELFRDVWQARNAYIDVILNRKRGNREQFFAAQSRILLIKKTASLP